MSKKEYLGDGLYVADDGFQFELSAEQMEGMQRVYLDGPTLTAFMKFVARSRGLEIVVKKDGKEIAL